MSFPHKGAARHFNITCLAAAITLALPLAAHAQSIGAGDLIVSGSVYQDVGQAANLVAGSSILPGSDAGVSSTAVQNGVFQNVFLNDGADPSFGVTSQIFLNDYSTSTNSLNGTYNVNPGAMVNSFSSKSELALNVGTNADGSTAITFMDYTPVTSYSSSNLAGVTVGGANNLGLLDLSNSNTPGVVDPTNLVSGASAYRSVGQVNLSSLTSSITSTGTAGVYNLNTGAGFQVTNTNAYSGNNGRAAILVSGRYYMVGNAGNSGSAVTGSMLSTLSQNTGVQTIIPGSVTGNSTVVGACGPAAAGSAKGFNCGYQGASTDKTGKDDNFRGLTVVGSTMFVSKGSGSNGVDSVYAVNGYQNPATATISILPGFNTTSAKTAGVAATGAPFGLWAPNSTTLYVAFEGDGTEASTTGSFGAGSMGGINKYSLINGTWQLDYSLTNGLNTSFTTTNTDGSAFSVGSTGTPTTLYTQGLRNITGRVNADGSVTIYGVTATVTNSSVSANWDQGANPDQIVQITDKLTATSAAAAGSEVFAVDQTATAGTVFRGVALAPAAAVPEPSTYGLMGLGLAILGGISRRRRQA